LADKKKNKPKQQQQTAAPRHTKVPKTQPPRTKSGSTTMAMARTAFYGGEGSFREWARKQYANESNLSFKLKQIVEGSTNA